MQVFYIKVTIKQAYACVSRTRVEPYSCRHALRTSEKKKLFSIRMSIFPDAGGVDF